MSHQKRPLSSKPSPNSLLGLFSKASTDTESNRKRRRDSLEQLDEIDDASSSSSLFTLSSVKNDAKTASHQPIPLMKAQVDNLDNQIHSDEDDSSTTSQLSSHSHFREGEGTRQKRFDNSILLYSTEVMERLAADTSQEMVEELEAQDGPQSNQHLLLASNRHTKAIMEAVRRRLRECTLPEFYASIAEGDTCKIGMERINKERALDLEKTALLSNKLAEQKKQLEKRLETETSKRNKLKEEEEWMRQTSRKKVHPLIASYLERSEKGTDTGKGKQRKTTTLEYIPAPPGTMSNLLDKIISDRHS